MNSAKSSKQPITKIVNQISKLKKQLQSIKSMKSIPLLQLDSLPHSQSTDKINRPFMKKHKAKSTLHKPKQSLILAKTMDDKERVQTERKKVGSQIDMSICKEIRRSISKSDSKNKSKTKEKRSLSSKNFKKNETKRKKKTKSSKNQKQIQKVSQFDNFYAHTRSIRKENEKNLENFELQETQKFNAPNNDRIDEPLIRQEISFGNQVNFRKNHKVAQKSESKSSTSGNKVCFKENNLRVKAKANYEPQFNSLNFNLRAQFEENIVRSPHQNRKNNLVNSYGLKSQVLLNKLKKSLLRFPNFSVVLQDQSSHQVPIQLKRLLNEINEKSELILEQRYTQYLQQVQCDLNQIINLFNQYQNQRESISIKNITQLIGMSASKERELKEQKENCLSLINLNEVNARQNEVEALKKQIKQTRKVIKKLEKQIKQKNQEFLELEFKYVLKCEQQQNQIKFVKEQTQKSPISTQNDRIHSHIQILQQQNLQLYQKIQFLNRQIEAYRNIQIQSKNQIQELRSQLNQISSQFQKLEKAKEIQVQDLNLAQIQIDSLKEKLSELTDQKQTQKQRYKKKVHSIQVQNQNLTKKIESQAQELKAREILIKKFETENYKLQQFLSANQTHYEKQIEQLKKHNQKYQRNETILNQKVEELTKHNFTLNKNNQNISFQNEKLKHEIRQVTQETTVYKQRLMSMEKVEKASESLKKENSKLLAKIESIGKQLKESGQNVLILKTELETEYKRVKLLQESIERYKDRCIKAQIQLKQGKYLEQKGLNKQKQAENIQQIQSIIKSHKEKLKRSE